MSNPKGGPNKFKPGTSGNPSGRPPDPPALKELKKLNRLQMEELMHEVLQLSRDELKSLSRKKNESAVKIMLARVLDTAIRTGDYKRAEFFFGRLYGKVPMRIADADGQPVSFVGLIQMANKKDAA